MAVQKKTYATEKEILELLQTGVLLAVLWTSPIGGAMLAKHFSLKLFDKVWSKYNQARLKQSLKRMTDRKLLEIKKVGDEILVVVSEKGKKELLRYNFQKMSLEKPKVWDGKWHVVIFDVVESKKNFRNALRQRIKELGMFQLQKSVFVTPYPCEKEIAFLRQYFQIGDEVSVFTAVNLEEEGFLKKKFRLKSD